MIARGVCYTSLDDTKWFYSSVNVACMELLLPHGINCYLSTTGNRTLAFGRRWYSRPSLATAESLVKGSEDQGLIYH